MYIVPYNTGEALLDFFLMTHLTIPPFLAYANITVQRVLVLCMLTLLTLLGLFSMDALSIFLPVPRHEFTHPFGPIALMAWATARYLLQILENSGISAVQRTKIYYNLIWILIGITGGVVHRDFFLSWLICWLFVEHVVTKYVGSTRLGTVVRTMAEKRKKVIIMGTGFGAAVYAVLEILAKVLNKPVLSPSLRIYRFTKYTLPALDFIKKYTRFIGHSTKGLPPGYHWRGFGDGIVTLPIGYLMAFRLDVPTLHGTLVVKKDLIDYMLPGLFAWTFDFGYLGPLILCLWIGSTVYVGASMLNNYIKIRSTRVTRFVAREALLFGSLTAFSIQSLIGAFLFSRAMNSFALATFTFLSAMIWAHVLRRR